MERLAKIISRSGFCSRREAERIIQEGRVTKNKVQVTEVVTLASIEDVIEIDGVMLFIPKTKLWKYYKPRGIITTHKDPGGRPTIFENINISSHIISIGRLDIESEGLLLLTNSGELARQYELPSNNFARQYKVKAYGKYKSKDLEYLRSGIEVDGIKYKPCDISLIKTNNSNHWFHVTLYEGKNREIRKIFNSINMMVSRLIRTDYGPFSIEQMKPGEIKEVKGFIDS
ncbi:MAG: pseudouridine synthase [Rickettsiaceae bacterium]|nr:pseudouridine synthase [Rickettsiaceae bacterium]